MNKPISMIINETSNSVAQVLNASGLSYSVLELIMRDLYAQVRENAQIEYKQSKQKYEQELEEQNAQEEDIPEVDGSQKE